MAHNLLCLRLHTICAPLGYCSHSARRKVHAGYKRKCGPLAEMLDRVLQLELRTIRLQTNASHYS